MSTDNFNKHFNEAAANFRVEAIKAFVPICQQYGFILQQTTQKDIYNPFVVYFNSSEIVICISGLGWGAYIDVSVARVGSNPFYSISKLFENELPKELNDGDQTDQMHSTAQWLQVNAQELLSGNVEKIELLDEKIALDERLKQEAIEADKQLKLATGYIEVENNFGELILRKPRHTMPIYEQACKQFPNAYKVIMAEEMLYSLTNDQQSAKGVICQWIKDIDEEIKHKENLCIIETDKVEIEYPAPCSGILVWLLPEGSMVSNNEVIALIKPK